MAYAKTKQQPYKVLDMKQLHWDIYKDLIRLFVPDTPAIEILLDIRSPIVILPPIRLRSSSGIIGNSWEYSFVDHWK